MLLVEAGLAPTRARAQALVLAGQVVVDDQRVDKPGTRVSAEAVLRLKGEPMPYVSRGGPEARGRAPPLPARRARGGVRRRRGEHRRLHRLPAPGRSGEGLRARRGQGSAPPAAARAMPRVVSREGVNARFLDGRASARAGGGAGGGRELHQPHPGAARGGAVPRPGGRAGGAGEAAVRGRARAGGEGRRGARRCRPRRGGGPGAPLRRSRWGCFRSASSTRRSTAPPGTERCFWSPGSPPPGPPEPAVQSTRSLGCGPSARVGRDSDPARWSGAQKSRKDGTRMSGETSTSAAGTPAHCGRSRDTHRHPHGDAARHHPGRHLVPRAGADPQDRGGEGQPGPPHRPLLGGAGRLAAPPPRRW